MRLAVLAEPPWWPASQWQVLLGGAGCASLTQATADHAPQRSNNSTQRGNWCSGNWQFSTSRRLGHIFVRVRYAGLTLSPPHCRHAQAERASPAAESSFLSLMDDEDEFEDDEYEAGQEVLKVKATEEVDETLKVRPRSGC